MYQQPSLGLEPFGITGARAKRGKQMGQKIASSTIFENGDPL
jgi:hypothetical protein